MVFMSKAFLRPLIVVVALLVLPGFSLSDSPKPPFSVAIAPTFNANGSGSIEIALGSPRDFYVLLTNISNEPQPVWETWNSWGYQTVSFEFATKDGKIYTITRRVQDFDKNFPSTFIVQPGEHKIFAIHLDEWWISHPTFPKVDETPITVKAIYEVQPTPESTKYKLWTGRIESHPYNFTVRQW